MITAMPYVDIMAQIAYLQEAGFTEQQARAQIKIVQDMQLASQKFNEEQRKELSTKGDLQDLRIATQKDMQDIRIATQNDIQDIRVELEKFRGETQKMYASLLRWQIGIGVAIVLALLKLPGLLAL